MGFQIKKDLKAHIFRAYDIRGLVPQELDEDAYYSVGRSIGTMLISEKESVCVLGFDGRHSSERLSQALKSGLNDSGVDVVSVGLVPSPVLYFSLEHLKIKSGVMVTGSHNPKDYNGIKIVVNGRTLQRDEILSLYHRIQSDNLVSGSGNAKEQCVIDAYIEAIKASVSLNRQLKLAIDCGNGVAGRFAGRLFRELGAEVLELFCEVDGDFPNHHPDPTVEKNLIALKQFVKENQCDLGLAFDGDADRVGVVTDKAETIWSDRLLMVLSQDILSRHQNASIVYDVKCSSLLEKLINEWQGRGVMCATGHSIIKARMKEEGALLAGEMSGHIFIKDRWYGFDDGLYAGARLLEIIANSKKSTSEVFSELPNSFTTPELNIPIAEENKFEFVDAFKSQVNADGAEKVCIDGLRLTFPFGWGLLRASNTSPNLVVRFEAESEEKLQWLQSFFKEQLLSLDDSLTLPF